MLSTSTTFTSPAFSSATVSSGGFGSLNGASFGAPAGSLPRSARDFDTLFQTYQQGLRHFLSRRLFSPEEVEDALVVTFCNAWQARAAYRGEAAARTWLYQIAHRVALDRLRAMRRRPVVELDPIAEQLAERMVDPTADPAHLVTDRDQRVATRSAVDEAMSRLSPEDAALVRLHYFDELNYEAISAQLGITRSQVKGRLHRIRARMERDLTQRQGWAK